MLQSPLRHAAQVIAGTKAFAQRYHSLERTYGLAIRQLVDLCHGRLAVDHQDGLRACTTTIFSTECMHLITP